MTDKPAPLVPPACDLRDFAYMPLDVVRLRDSGLAAIPDAEAFRAAVLAWCVSWHQSPAASLPDDDMALCRLLGYGRDVKGWQKVRKAGALHGFILCADGRLYHPVVAEKALEAWSKKRAQRDRTEAARRARQSQAQSQEPRQNELQPSSQPLSHSLSQEQARSVTEDATEPVTASKGREGKGEEGKELSRASADAPPARLVNPLVDVTPCPKTGRGMVKGWYLDRTSERVFEAAGINEINWRGDLAPLIAWLSDGFEPDQIVEAVKRVATRPGYRTPRTLAYFNDAVREQRRAA